MEPRRFAPPGTFLCGAAYMEIGDAGGVLVWADGTRVEYPRVTLQRALLRVFNGLWEEQPVTTPADATSFRRFG